MVQLAAASGAGNSFTTILFLLLLFGVVYFLMIRPQQKRRREAAELQNRLGPGDQIVTIGGLHGTIVAIEDDVATLEVAPGVQVKFARPAIARVVQRHEAEEAPADEPVADDEPAVDDSVDTQKKD